jgi:phosphate transport system permease protein
MKAAIFAGVAAAAIAAGCAQAAMAQSRDQIRIVGSSTVFPYTQAVAEQFAGMTGSPAPVVESTGTGGGMQVFCGGVGPTYPDITGASRAMTKGEYDACIANGVDNVTEVLIGYDGLSIAHDVRGPDLDLTEAQVFAALASEVEIDGAIVANPYKNWSEIDPSLPDAPIQVFGPPPTSGTRDAFVELVMHDGCNAFPAIAALEESDEDRWEEVCGRMRQDGPFIEAGENDNLIVQRLQADPNALGIFGYSFLFENQDTLKAVAIDGVLPALETIAAGSYAVARPLYIYIKNAHRGVIPGLDEFVVEYVSEESFGPGGYLSERGLVPLPDDQRDQVRATPLHARAPVFGYLLLTILALSLIAYFVGRSAGARFACAADAQAHSLPGYHGAFVAIWVGVPALILALLWAAFQGTVIDGLLLAGLPPDLATTAAQKSLLLSEIRNVSAGQIFAEPSAAVLAAAERLQRFQSIARIAQFVVALCVMMIGLFLAQRRLAPRFRARNAVERSLSAFMIFCSVIAILTTIGIIASLLYESWAFFRMVPPADFFFGLKWEPQIAIRTDQIAGAGAFGAVPVFVGTLVISLIAMAVAIPIGIFTAIYLVEYAHDRVRAVVKPALEVLAGVPSVVYGFFAVLTVAPAIRNAGGLIGIGVSPNSALAAGLVMGVMIIPFVSSLADDTIRAVPRSMRDGSLAIGATRAETMTRVLLPAALPGIMGGVLLALSRAIGETMIVVMAAGLIASMNVNPLDSVTTVTVQIVSLLIGDTAFDSPKTLAAFALGLVLFVVTLTLNVIALSIVRRFREQYE